MKKKLKKKTKAQLREEIIKRIETNMDIISELCLHGNLTKHSVEELCSIN